MAGNEKYTHEWKIACLEFLREKRRQLRQSVGYKRLGWGPIRNLIMQPYDKIVNGEIVLASSLLNESTLDAWDRRGDGSISDNKFRFIDNYIRILAIEGNDSTIVEMLRCKRFREISNALCKVYRPAHLRADTQLTDSKLPDWALKSALWELPNKENMIAIRFLETYRNSLHLLCAVMPYVDSEKDLPDGKKLIFFEGVAVPVSPLRIQKDSKLIIDRYLVKLFRDEFSGLTPLGYADGEIEVSHLPSYHPSVRIDLFGPNNWFNPKQFYDISHISPELTNPNIHQIDDELHMSAPINRSRGHGFSGFINNSNNNGNFVDSIFDAYYQGYLVL